MIQKEKNLLWVFITILVIGSMVKGVPFAIKSYQAGIDEVELLKEKRRRLKKLLARTDYWRAEFEKTNQKQQHLLTKLFVGQSAELIAARVQGNLKELAKKSNIKVDSMSLPDFQYQDDWLLVTQTLSFKTPSQQLMIMINLIKQSNPRLVIIDIQVQAYRRQLNCTLKIVGFSRTLEEQGSDE
jgi:hypothetical protein